MAHRSPRQINFQHNALAGLPFRIGKPPVDSISWKLWLACTDIAEQALASDYMQGIKAGSLHPNTYGQYTVQDAAYCYNAVADYETVEKRATSASETELAAFAQARIDSYRKYNKSFLEDWHISSGAAVNPSPAVQAYIDFERHVALNMEPIYGILAMLPCEQLWPWLATELLPCATATNLYSFWIEENNYWHGAYRLDNFIDQWFADHPAAYDWATALFVMKSCMTCEVNFFRSACGQPLLPMPKMSSL
ncbi:hypothetical protein BSKO_06765 [Bryopsis sp. KO-2023]|nr:hypothetical protein BSKO_06765 [Bryopsis sp. KO-2023]